MLCAYQSRYEEEQGRRKCFLPEAEKKRFCLEVYCILPDKCPRLAHIESQASQPTPPLGWMTDTYE